MLSLNPNYIKGVCDMSKIMRSGIPINRADSEVGERHVEFLGKMSKGGCKMTAADYRAQGRSFSLATAKTPEDRETSETLSPPLWCLRHDSHELTGIDPCLSFAC